MAGRLLRRGGDPAGGRALLGLPALAVPVVDGLHRDEPPARSRRPRRALGIAFVAALLTFAGQQVANGAQDLADQASAGLEEIRTGSRPGPCASDSQINDYIQKAQDGLKNTGSHVDVGNVTEVGTALGHVVAGFFIIAVLDLLLPRRRRRIWAWLVRIAPRAARPHVDTPAGWPGSRLTRFFAPR